MAIGKAVASGGVRQASFEKTTSYYVVSDFSECRRTHTLFEYPPGKSLEAKLLKELVYWLNCAPTCSVAMLVL